MKTKWQNSPIYHKVITVGSLIVSLAVVVLAVLQIFDVWDRAIDI